MNIQRKKLQVIVGTRKGFMDDMSLEGLLASLGAEMGWEMAC